MSTLFSAHAIDRDLDQIFIAGSFSAGRMRTHTIAVSLVYVDGRTFPFVHFLESPCSSLENRSVIASG